MSGNACRAAARGLPAREPTIVAEVLAVTKVQAPWFAHPGNRADCHRLSKDVRRVSCLVLAQFRGAPSNP